MKNKTTRFFVISLFFVIIMCFIIFAFATANMNRRSARAMNELAEMYMEGMSGQITQHMSAITEAKCVQMDMIVEDLVSNHMGDDIRSLLAQNTAVNTAFDHMAFYMEDGTVDMVYGDPIAASDIAVLASFIDRGEKKMIMGADTEDEQIILLEVPMSYDMGEKGMCRAIVAGVEVSGMTEIFKAGMEEPIIFYLIDSDGEIIMQGDGEHDCTYFDKVRRHYEESNHEESAQEIETYITELKTAIGGQEDYVGELTLKMGRRRIYGKSLPNSKWYLILSMPYSGLDQIVKNFGQEWMRTALDNGATIITLLLLVFMFYFLVIQQQIRSTEEARQLAEQSSRAKSEFLSNMSHDLRTPMNGIMGMTEIASANLHDEEKLKVCLHKISASSKQLLRLINDVLDMAKIENGKMTLNQEQIMLPEIVHSVVNDLQPYINEKGHRFDLHIHDIQSESVWGDSARLSQILIKIMGNAIKFTPDHGKIQLELWQEPSEKGDQFIRVHLQVKDNGIGMSEAFQKKIFDSFVRADNARVEKTAGAGLGLSITKYIVDAMEGQILVESEPDKGSEFHVILDMEKAPTAEELVDLPAWRTLVIDDDEVFCDCTVATLNSIGIDGHWALSGREALQMMEEQHNLGNDYEIVLVDWKLPEMDGFEVAAQIRERYGRAVRILMISAYDNADINEKMLQSGIDAFIVKPLFKSTLCYNLHKFMEADRIEAAQTAEEELVFHGERVLVAEDNDLNWEIANALLTDLGLQPEHAENGQMCLDMFSGSAEGYYGAILMDIRMPVMTGHESAMAIRALTRADAEHIPIIAMSADAFADDVERCLHSGMNAHTPKPIEINRVASLLKRYMFA